MRGARSLGGPLAFGLAAFFATQLPAFAVSPNNPSIVTESGPLKGIVSAQINEYLGIPYAAPPVGALRWTPPQGFGHWHGVFEATQFASQCPQAGGGEENCLFLNIYTPAARDRHDGSHDWRDDDGHAVMVWIHGGGLTAGAGSDFDPTQLVKEGDVIVVTINYRLGLLGFLAHPALDSEGHLAGNYGLMDQQFALRWVRRNIAAFGGNPSRVTIFGESAGGLSVYSQLASPLAAGLFQLAIAQSGAYGGFTDYRITILPLSVAETTGDPQVPSGTAIADALGCTSQTSTCLRGVTASTLIHAQPKRVYPFVDGVLLTQQPVAAFASGEFNRVPVVTGTNHDEYRYFVAEDYDLSPLVGPLANANYPMAILATFGSTMAPSVLTQYPLPPSPPTDAASLALGAAGTDGIFGCTARRAMEGLASYVTVYAYEFNDEDAPPPTGFPTLSFPLGAYHGADVQYLFSHPSSFTPDQVRLSQSMMSYWSRFAKTGDPNSPDQPRWAPYDPTTDLRQSLVPPTPVVESGYATDHMCAFWDTL